MHVCVYEFEYVRVCVCICFLILCLFLCLFYFSLACELNMKENFFQSVYMYECIYVYMYGCVYLFANFVSISVLFCFSFGCGMRVFKNRCLRQYFVCLFVQRRDLSF